MAASASIVRQIEKHNLPVFNSAKLSLHNILRLGEVNWHEIAEIIMKDPGLILHVLQLLYNNPKRKSAMEVSDMSQALMLLGMERVKSIIDGVDLVEESLPEQYQHHYKKAVNRAYHAAFQARNWAQWRNDHAPEEIFIATMMHYLPEFALWVSEPEKMYATRKCIYSDGMSVDEAQHIMLGKSLQHFGRMVISDLHFPTFIHDVFRPEMARIVRIKNVLLAVELADAAEFGWYHSKLEHCYQQVAEILNKSLSDTIKIVHLISIHAAQSSPDASVSPAATLLPMIHSDRNYLIEQEFIDHYDSNDKVVHQLQEGGGTSKSNVVEHSQDHATAEVNPGSTEVITAKPETHSKVSVDYDQLFRDGVTVCFCPQPTVYAKAVMDLEDGMGRLDANQIVRLVVHGMHDGIGLHRVVFAAISPKGDYLEARYLTGSDNDSAFNKFKIKLDKLNLFSRLLEKPANLWINDENRGKYWSLIPSEFKVLIKVNCFCAMSVFVDNRAIGMFYADRHSVDCKIDKQAYNLFRHIASLASKCLQKRPKNKS